MNRMGNAKLGIRDLSRHLTKKKYGLSSRTPDHRMPHFKLRMPRYKKIPHSASRISQ